MAHDWVVDDGVYLIHSNLLARGLKFFKLTLISRVATFPNDYLPAIHSDVDSNKLIVSNFNYRGNGKASRWTWCPIPLVVLTYRPIKIGSCHFGRSYLEDFALFVFFVVV